MIAGSVVALPGGRGHLHAADDRRPRVRRRSSRRQTFAEVVRNLGEAYVDATGQMRDMLDRGRMLFAYGIFYPEGGDTTFEAKHIVFVGRTLARLRLRAARTGGCTRSARSPTSTCGAQWPDGNIDYTEYRTRITLEGEKLPGTRQETDTISRLVYGLATAYLLTGEDRFLEAAEKGTEYLRDHMRTVDAGEGIAYWVHGIDTSGGEGEEDPRVRVRRRLRRDPGLRADLRARRPDADLPRHGRPADPERHRDDASSSSTASTSTATAAASSRTSTRSRSTRAARRSGTTRSRKNWNSVGDHAPAYLINAYLATGQRRSTPTSSRSTADTIVQPLPRLREQPVRERALPRGLVATTTRGAGSTTAPSSATT